MTAPIRLLHSTLYYIPSTNTIYNHIFFTITIIFVSFLFVNSKRHKSNNCIYLYCHSTAVTTKSNDICCADINFKEYFAIYTICYYTDPPQLIPPVIRDAVDETIELKGSLRKPKEWGRRKCERIGGWLTDSRKVQIYKKQNWEKSSKFLSHMFLSLMPKLHKEGVQNINGQHTGRRITLLHCDYCYFFLSFKPLSTSFSTSSLPSVVSDRDTHGFLAQQVKVLNVVFME